MWRARRRRRRERSGGSSSSPSGASIRAGKSPFEGVGGLPERPSHPLSEESGRVGAEHVGVRTQGLNQRVRAGVKRVVVQPCPFLRLRKLAHEGICEPLLVAPSFTHELPLPHVRLFTVSKAGGVQASSARRIGEM